MKKPWRLVGSLALAGVLAWRLDWNQLGESLASLHPGYCLAALTVYLLTQLISAVRWRMLALALGLDISYPRTVALYFLGMFFNLVLPSSVGGDFVRAWYLAGQRQRLGPAFLSVLAERLTGVAVLALLAGVGAIFCPVDLPGWMLGLALAVSAGAVVGLLSLPWLPMLERIPWVGKKIAGPLQAARVFRRQPGVMLLALLLSLPVQLGNVVLALLVGMGLGLDIPATFYLVLVPLVTLLTLVPISLNGMGLREMGTVLLLAPLGIGSGQAVTLALGQFAVYTTASLGGGLVYLFASGPRIEKVETNDDHSVRGDSDQGRTGQSAAAA